MSSLAAFLTDNPTAPKVREVAFDSNVNLTITARDARNNAWMRRWEFLSQHEYAKYSSLSGAESSRFLEGLTYTGNSIPRSSPGWEHGGDVRYVVIKPCEPGTNKPRDT